MEITEIRGPQYHIIQVTALSSRR